MSYYKCHTHIIKMNLHSKQLVDGSFVVLRRDIAIVFVVKEHDFRIHILMFKIEVLACISKSKEP